MSAERKIDKTIVDQIKETIKNKDQIRENLIQNFKITRRMVEVQAKDLLQKTRKSKFFNDNIVPLASSELADKAIEVLNVKFKLKNTQLMKQVEKIRKDIVESKVSKAKPAKKIDAE